MQHPVAVPNGGGSHPLTHPNSGGDHPANPLPGEHGDKPAGGGDKPAGGGDKPPAVATSPRVVATSRPPARARLLVGSKPPCDIFIDGSSTGLHTPAKDIKLSAGKHKVTLVNNEFSIRDTFTVEIKADQPEKAIKDYSAKINKTE